MSQNKLTYIILLLLFSSSINAQWNKGKGNGYYKISAWSLVADKHYTDTGALDPNATRGTFNLSFYGEYGLTDKLDLIAYVPFFTRVYQNEQKSAGTGLITKNGEALNSIGDTDLGIRYGLIKNSSLALSTTLKLGLPIGNSSGGSDGSFQTGDGEFNQNLQVDLGLPFKISSIPAYAKAYVGYNNRSKGFSDETHFGGEIGFNLFQNKFWITGRLNAVKSTNNGSLNAQNSNGSIFANNIEYTSLGIEGAYYLTKKLGISLGYATAINGRLIYANPTLSGGIFLDIK